VCPNLNFKIKLFAKPSTSHSPKTRPFWHRLMFHPDTVNYVMTVLYSQVCTVQHNRMMTNRWLIPLHALWSTLNWCLSPVGCKTLTERNSHNWVTVLLWHCIINFHEFYPFAVISCHANRHTTVSHCLDCGLLQVGGQDMFTVFYTI